MMDFLLDTLPRKLMVATAAAAAAAGIFLLLARQFQVERLSSEGTAESLGRAIALQPENSELHNRLGRMLLFSVAGDPARSAVELERAAELDPRSGRFWVDVSMAREMTGDMPGAQKALERARAAEPHTPFFLWQQMNFALRSGANQQAIDLGRELLAQAPEYTLRALPLLAQVADMRALVETVVPQVPNALAATIEYLCNIDQAEAAQPAWERLVALGNPPPSNVLRRYVDTLLNKGVLAPARKAWTESIRRGWVDGDAEALSEPLYNADFRRPLLNFGFDWRVLPHPDASAWIEARGPQPGQQSLCVQFADGARAEYGHLMHLIPVQPDTVYSLHGELKTNRLVSRSGAYLEVAEVQPKPHAGITTLPLMGSSSWEEFSLRLTTSPEAQLVRLTLNRPAPIASEPPATGLVCLANLEWKALGPASLLNVGRTGR